MRNKDDFEKHVRELAKAKTRSRFNTIRNFSIGAASLVAACLVIAIISNNPFSSNKTILMQNAAGDMKDENAEPGNKEELNGEVNDSLVGEDGEIFGDSMNNAVPNDSNVVIETEDNVIFVNESDSSILSMNLAVAYALAESDMETIPTDTVYKITVKDEGIYYLSGDYIKKNDETWKKTDHDAVVKIRNRIVKIMEENNE